MARPFEWTDDHEIFLPEIDAEHRNLYRLGAELTQALAAGARMPKLKEMVRAAAVAVEDHFVHEERLMQEARYMSLSWHRSQHDAARKRVVAFGGRIEAGDKEAIRELLTYMAAWMQDHVAVADRMMGASLRNRNRFKTAAA